MDSEAEMTSELTDGFRKMLTLDDSENKTQTSETDRTRREEAEREEREGEEEEEEEEEEFSFVCLNHAGVESVISAEDAFQDGQIRSGMFPVFDQSLLFSDSSDEKCGEKRDSSTSLRSPVRKVFVAEEKGYASSGSELDESEGSREGEYCLWSGKSLVEVKASPEACKKSYSTGFSKIWRLTGLAQRSNSDGKDAFVFLNAPSSSSDPGAEKPIPATAKTIEADRARTPRKERSVVTKKTTVSSRKSAHEKLYVRNKAKKEGEKRKSYLPYKQDLVRFGFFTSVNSLSRNLHPY